MVKRTLESQRQLPHNPRPAWQWNLPLEGLYDINEQSNWPTGKKPVRKRPPSVTRPAKGGLYKRTLANFTRSHRKYKQYSQGKTPWHRALARHERQQVSSLWSALKNMDKPSRLAPRF